MRNYTACSPREAAAMDTEALRRQFLVENLFTDGHIRWAHTHCDRMITGGASPLEKPLVLENEPALKADYFLERRELGIINIGGPGRIVADGAAYVLEKLDCLYLGKGTRSVWFESVDPGHPARFFLMSAPAHHAYPHRLMPAAEATPTEMGDAATANKRTVYKYIHLDGIPSCQLVMGLTILHPGNVWNTMPPHTHDRRSEVYCYFDVPEDHRVLHLMGQAESTRPLWVGNHQAIISPSWSIHAGCGTMAYSFIWAMAGENQSFADMDFIRIADLR